jgi:hypothetical protein
MSHQKLRKALNYAIAIVWILNGLFCKVLHLVPRHEQIVSKILGTTYSRPFTVIIGCLEIGMAIWILSGVKVRLNAIVQIIIIGTMNTIEFILVPDLLLWGRFNAVFAFLLILVIYINEFYLNKKLTQQT